MKRPWTEGPLGLLFLMTVDLIAVFDAFALGYLCRFRWGFLVEPLPPAPPGAYVRAWLLVGYVTVVLFHAWGLYDRRKCREPIDALGPLLRASGAAGVLMLALGYFYRGFSYSRLAALFSFGFSVLLLGMFRTAWEAYRNQRRSRVEACAPVLLVGSRTVPQFLRRRLAEDSSYGFRVVAVCDSVPIDPDLFPDLPRGGLEDVPDLLAATGAREVFVGHPSLGHLQLLELIEICERRELRIRMVPATYDLLIDDTDLEEVGGIPLVSVNERRPRRGFRVAKRCFDLASAGILLVLLSPLLLTVAVGVRLQGGGPVLFRQRRVGRDGEVFEIIKFRTMVQEAEALLPALVNVDRLREPVFKIERDPRVTRFGRFLRRFSLDELPQLWNVLRGEMSLVGPRPEEESMVARYDIWERRRLKLTPGMTGLQQIHCRGSGSLKERVRWDIIYLRKESFLLDLWILLRTIGVVLGGRGAH